MTPAEHLHAAIQLLGDIDSVPRPADAIISGYLRQQKVTEDKDRAAILMTVYGVMRHRARLGWWLDRQNGENTARGRVIVWLILAAGKTQAHLERMFIGGEDAPALLTDREMALIARIEGGTMPHPSMPESVLVECPDWAEDALRARFGEAFATEMQAMLDEPALDLRVNTLKADHVAMLKELRALGLPVDTTTYAARGLRINARLSLSRLPGLRTGEIEIQDEGSQLVAQLVDAKPGDRVVDFCAGAAGKTLAIAAQMKNKGQIIACDVNEGRLKRGAERLRQAGVHNAVTRLLSSESDKWIKRHKLGYDRVLIDAPCSGSGTWRRNPDARWRAPEEKGLDNLVALQARILTSAARLVKPGGRLVYATCSLLASENEDQVTAFLAANPAFTLVPLAEVAPNLATLAEGPYLSLTPARHDTDGFFAAVLQRAPLAEEPAAE